MLETIEKKILEFNTAYKNNYRDGAGSANTAAIIAKLDAIEDSRKDRELAEKDRMIATLTARSERQSELQPIYNALNEIQCNQPPVKKVACAERYVPVNEGINATYGLIPNYCGYGFPFGGNFFNGFLLLIFGDNDHAGAFGIASKTEYMVDILLRK